MEEELPSLPQPGWEPALSHSTPRPTLQNFSPGAGGGAERKGKGNIIPLVGVGWASREAGRGRAGFMAGERISGSSPPSPHPSIARGFVGSSSES